LSITQNSVFLKNS